jgi:hypothetical protein
VVDRERTGAARPGAPPRAGPFDHDDATGADGLGKDRREPVHVADKGDHVVGALAPRRDTQT